MNMAIQSERYYTYDHLWHHTGNTVKLVNKDRPWDRRKLGKWSLYAGGLYTQVTCSGHVTFTQY